MAQRQSVVVLPSIADQEAKLSPRELDILTEKVRSIIPGILPLKDFNLLKQDVVLERLGAEGLFAACKEGSCVGDLVARVQADFGARCEVISAKKQLYLKFELYGTLRGEKDAGTIDQFNDPVKDFNEMLALLDKKAPAAFKKIVTEAVPTSTPAVVGSVVAQIETEPAGAALKINGIPYQGCPKTPCTISLYENRFKLSASLDEHETADTNLVITMPNQLVNIKLKPVMYQVNFSSQPAGASLSFDGEPYPGCRQTPCSARFTKGNVKVTASLNMRETKDTTVSVSQNNQRIDLKLFVVAQVTTEPSGAALKVNGIPYQGCSKTPCTISHYENRFKLSASLDEHETADTTVSIKQNNQNVRIRLKANFGVLEIKPAYSEGVGKNENWSLTINGKSVYSRENKLSPGKYSVKLSHRCYEDISFDVGINKDKREVFDMSSYAKPKKGSLALSAEKDGSPVSEPVFVDGQRAGETPFGGSVAICSEIGIGSSKEKVDVKLEYKQTVRYVHKIQSGGISGGVLTDTRDGKKYKVVKIGNQTWMAENLNYDASGSKCYENKPANCAKYGKLYNLSTAKNACPSGWHLPSKSEYEALDKAVGGEKVAGKKLKSKNGWNTGGGYKSGTDEFGFSALPGGHGGWAGSFGYVGYYGYWWSSSEYGGDGAYRRCMGYYSEDVGWDGYGKDRLFSVRCVKD